MTSTILQKACAPSTPLYNIDISTKATKAIQVSTLPWILGAALTIVGVS